MLYLHIILLKRRVDLEGLWDDEGMWVSEGVLRLNMCKLNWELKCHRLGLGRQGWSMKGGPRLLRYVQRLAKEH